MNKEFRVMKEKVNFMESELNGGFVANRNVTIVSGLNSNSTITKLKILDKLLDSQIIDTKENWTELSLSLRKCFVSSNHEIFTKSLKIHHKIITFPNTTCDGYLSLLKGTYLLLNSRYYNDVSKNRISQNLQLVISASNFVIKYLLYANHSLIDEIISTFINVLTFKSMFELFASLDPEALWLKHFCHGAYIRHTFFRNLHIKSEFIDKIYNDFLKKLSEEDEKNISYASFFLYYFQFKNSFEKSPELLLESILLKINHRKKLDLTRFVTNLLISNPSLLTSNVLDSLTEPLCNISRNNFVSTLKNNTHIFEIITQVAKSPNFRVLYEIHPRKNRSRQRNYSNLPHKIIEITINSFRLNFGDKSKLVSLLLRCCESLFMSHPSSFLHVNPVKFIRVLSDFYRSNPMCQDELKRTLLDLFKFFYTCYYPTSNILGAHNEILLDLFTFCKTEQLKVISARVSSDFIKFNKNKIVKCYIEKNYFDEDYDFDQFLFLLCVKINTRNVVELLYDDDDSTIVESDGAVSLLEVVENGLNGDGYDEHLGLLIMKVLITNLDLLLYLQSSHQVQDKLKLLNEEAILDENKSCRCSILCDIENVGFVDKRIDFGLEENLIIPKIEKINIFSENELRAFLEKDFRNRDFGWLGQARRVFKNCLITFDPFLFAILMEKMPKTYVYRKFELHWPPSDSVYYQLHPEDVSGISLIINFGIKSGFLKDVDEHNENLQLLIKQSRVYLNHKPEYFSNFDWFSSLAYLFSFGDFNKTKSTLINCTKTQVTPFIWATFSKEFDFSLQESFYQHLFVLLEENCTCFQAMTMLGITADILVQSWLNQCFFNVLTIEEVFNFLVFSVIYPVECLLYYFVAVFLHLNERICQMTHSPQIRDVLELSNLKDFKLCNYIGFIEKLIKRYRKTHKL